MSNSSYTVLQQCCQMFSSEKSRQWRKEDQEVRKEIDPIESLRLLTEHRSNFNYTIEADFLRVPPKEAQRIGGKIAKCFCGENALRYRLCPKHYFDAFWDIQQPYLVVKEVPTIKRTEVMEWPRVDFEDINFAESEDE